MKKHVTKWTKVRHICIKENSNYALIKVEGLQGEVVVDVTFQIIEKEKDTTFGIGRNIQDYLFGEHFNKLYYFENAEYAKRQFISMSYLARKNETRKCRVCGCTSHHACVGGCTWVDQDLCSKCENKEQEVKR